MSIKKTNDQPFYKIMPLLVVVIMIFIGITTGFVASEYPAVLGLIVILPLIVFCLIKHFEKTVIALLIIRTSLGIFSAQGLPAIYALALDGLAIGVVALQIFRRQKVYLDWFLVFFLAWVAFQSLWVILLPFGGLGMGGGHLPRAAREWTRIFSWPMVYLLVMQLKGKIHPTTMINSIFLSLIAPVTAATMQAFLPTSMLPSLLMPVELGGIDEGVSRIGGTFGHPNGFSIYCVLFICLTFWKVNNSPKPLKWLPLFGVLSFFLVSTKTLVGLVMAGVSLFGLIAPKLSPLKFIGGVVLFSLVVGLYASSDAGRERLVSISATPLLNPDIDLSRSVLMSWYDNNSFNWRIAQWTFLLDAWKQRPILGYGLQSSSYLSVFQNYAHSDYVRALTETGLLGFVSYIAFLVAQAIRLVQLIINAKSNLLQRDFCMALMAMFLAIIVGMITENIWYQTVLYFYWFTFLAIAGWNWNSDVNEASYL